jgi:hypothetical protein
MPDEPVPIAGSWFDGCAETGCEAEGAPGEKGSAGPSAPDLASLLYSLPVLTY